MTALLQWLQVHDGHPRDRHEYVDGPTGIAFVLLVCVICSDDDLCFVDEVFPR